MSDAWIEGGRQLAASGLLGDKAPARECQWVALAALFGGAFLRPQYEAWCGIQGRVGAARLVERIERSGLGREVDGGGGLGRYVHLYSRKLYAELGMGDSRYRRKPAPGHLLQRLLCVDHLLEHPGRGWLAGGEVAVAFRDLGVPDEALPRRIYAARGDGPPGVAFFPARWPVAVGRGRADFIFPDSGETARPVRDLRTWGAHHGALWSWLGRHDVRVSAVFVSRSLERAHGLRGELEVWSAGGVAYREGPEPDPRAELVRGEIAAIEAAVRGKKAEAVARWGDVLQAVRRRNALRHELEALEAGAPGALVRVRVPNAGTWVSGRLEARSGVAFGSVDPAELEVRRLSEVGMQG